jgi:release factor glutamine methyltransferase
VALALASERANATMIGVDISPAALAVARQNARVLRLDNLRLTVSNWFAALAPTLRACAIVANPPYVAAKDPHLVSGDPRFEPRTALVAGEDGLRDLAVIIAAAPNYLKARGNLLLEHGHNHGPRVRQMMRERGFQQVTTYQDTSSHERVTRGEHRG